MKISNSYQKFVSDLITEGKMSRNVDVKIYIFVLMVDLYV